VLYQHLRPAVEEAHGDVVVAVKRNAARRAKLLQESSTVIAKAVRSMGLRWLEDGTTWERGGWRWLNELMSRKRA
jgi:hypothetical protein